MKTAGWIVTTFALAFMAAGCPETEPEPEPSADGGTMDAGKKPDAGRDAGYQQPDAGQDAGLDAGSDAGSYDAGPDDECMKATGSGPAGTASFADGTDTAQVVIDDPSRCLRRYTLSSTAPRAENIPANPRTFQEIAGQPTVRTNNDLFDALYAMAIEEAREDSVDSISDGAFNNGQGVACPTGGCFETGRNWHYVWTRDTAFSVNLGLAPLDPTRARNSLEFKLSERREGGDLQIVQDTGTGGSWPVSTDRVSWAMGARTLLDWLDGAERTAFRDRAYDAVKNTLEHDRATIFDSTDGLYSGEQSFLDWREQTYPAWTAGDPAQIGMSKALSTNLLHLNAMRLAASLADEKGDSGARDRYQGWADALATAIRTRFKLDDGLYSSFSTTFLDPAPVRRYDLLATAFAVLLGVAEGEEAKTLVAGYPHAGKGPPTIWPQQQETAIYHNRSFWPFVTGYWLEAARAVRNDKVVDHGVWSLMRGAALSLSNMENFELVTGHTRVEEGPTSGPVVNSSRQLWSVAGYLSMVHKVVFGAETSAQGIRFRPYVTRAMRNGLFAGADRIVLNKLPYRGHELTVVVVLPAKAGATGGAYAVGSVKLDGTEVGADAFLRPDQLRTASSVEVTLVDTPEAAAQMRLVADTSNFRNLFGPRTPAVSAVALRDGLLELTIDRGNESAADVAFDIYRDGQRVATDVPGSTATWRDSGSAGAVGRTHCYAIESKFVASGNRSQHSRPVCYWGNSEERVQLVSAREFSATGGTPIVAHGRFHYQDWGDAGHSLEVATFRPTWTGEHLFQLVYGNGAGPINTGVTCAVKRLTVEELPAGTVVAQGYVAMPQLGDWEQWRDSSFVRATLDTAKTYRIRVDGDARAINMSVFAHFNQYTGGTGGSAGAFNRVNVSDLKVLALDGGSGAPAVVLDGSSDFDAFPASARVAPGIPVESWDNFAMTWDADYLYLAVVSKAFEDGFAPYMLYLQAAGGALPAAAARGGLTYNNQTANVPFEASFVATLRRTSDAADGSGPWNGLFRHENGAWARQTRFEHGRDWWVGDDQGHTISARIPWAQLGHPTKLRIAGHLVYGGGNYKDVMPSSTGGAQHEPWASGGTTGFFEIDLAGPAAASNWVHR